MLFMSQREVIKENLLFLLENGELLLSSKRYQEVLEKIVDILELLDRETIPLYRFLEIFKDIILILEIKKEIKNFGDILDFFIMALDNLKEFEDEIYDMDFEKIKIDTFLLQSSKQIAIINSSIVETLSILNLLKKDNLIYFLKNENLNIKIFKELKAIDKIDIILTPFNKTIIEKVRKKTDKPIIVISNNNENESLENFENVYFVSNKMDEDEFNKTILEVFHTYQCEYIRSKVFELKKLKPLGETIIKLKNLPEDTSLRDISSIISKDIGLSTKLVSFVNKPFFGVIKEISSVQQAITFLGKEKTLAYSFSLAITEHLGIKLNNYNLTENRFNKINLLRLQLASLWYRRVNFNDFITISSAAMLGNIGKLFLNHIIDYLDKEKFQTLLKIDRVFAENEVLKTTTEEITANLLTHWGFSNKLIDSIYYSNNIEKAMSDTKHLAIANYVIFKTFDLNEKIDDKIVKNMVDFLNEMNFDSTLYLKAIKKIKENEK